MKANLLLVEDNPRIQIANRDMLTLEGYEVRCAMNLAEARAHMAAQMPDAVILDIMLPDGSGYDLLAEIRTAGNTPVLMLTALGDTDSTVRGLSGGADDYLAKPYEYPVLAARIGALLRRAGQMPDFLKKGRLSLNLLSAQAFLDGTDMRLTKREFNCLLLLAQHENRFLSAEYLYETVWQMPLSGDTQAVRTVLTRLRRKLQDSGYALHHERGEGYCFTEK